MEKRKSHLEQPMEQTRGLFCTCDSVVARCQSQHQYHFWRMSSMFQAYCTGQVSLAADNQLCVIRELLTVAKPKDSIMLLTSMRI